MLQSILVLILILCAVLHVLAAYSGCPKQSYDSACGIGSIAEVTLPGGTIQRADCNLVVPRSRVSGPPTSIKYVVNGAIIPGQRYTIVVVDPDYKNPSPRGKPYLVWIRANALAVTANDFLDLTVGKTLAGWRAPNFSQNPGPHRVVILAFKHRAPSLFLSNPVSYYDRKYFNLASWLYWNGNTLDCTPSGGFQVIVA